MNSRQFRLDCINNVNIVPEFAGIKVDGRIFKGSYGRYRHITVNNDGSITINNKAFVDDVIAFMFYAIIGNPTISSDIKDLLRQFVIKMDKRALDRHGYKNSPDEMMVDFVVRDDVYGLL